MPGPRVVPLTCEDVYRLACEALDLIKTNELHTTSDHHRIFMDGFHAGPAWHGIVSDAVAMINLRNTSSRSVHPIDFCYRTDTGSTWMCITRRGQEVVDWLEITGGSTGADIIDGLNAAANLTDIVDGGSAADEYTTIVSGNSALNDFI